MKEFRLPDPGEGLVEAEIVTWRVAAGDEVKINDIVVEVETSKSLVELPIPFAGTISALLVAEGDMVEVGAPIIQVDDGVTVPTPARSEPATGSESRVANLVGYGPRATDTRRRPRRVGTSAESATAARDGVASSFDASQPVSRRADEVHALEPEPQLASTGTLPDPGQASTEPGIASGPVLAKPPVRKLAKDLGVDLTQLAGSGDGGIITRDDVTAAAEPSPSGVSGTSDPNVGFFAYSPLQGEAAPDRVVVKGVRQATADAVTASALGVPHVTEWLSCDVTATMELVDRLRGRRDLEGVRINSMVIIAKAVTLALRRHRSLNASWDGPAGEIAYQNTVNLGIAAATPRGLLVPNVKAAERLDLAELANRLTDLVQTAREGRTQPPDLVGGTFTITNIGVFGVDGGTPILNRGESGILCVGQIARRPWVIGSGVDERIEPRWVTTLAVSFDHRVADGAEGSQFLADVAQILTDPTLAMLFG